MATYECGGADQLRKGEATATTCRRPLAHRRNKMKNDDDFDAVVAKIRRGPLL